MEKKYYIAYQSAEEVSSGIVYLTDDEYKAAKEFLSQIYNFSAGYCGTCGIGDKSFPSEEEAKNALYEEENGEDDPMDEVDFMIGEMIEHNFTCK